MLSWGHLGTTLGSLWDNFGITLGALCFLGSLWDHYMLVGLQLHAGWGGALASQGATPGRPGCSAGITLGQLWDHFGSTLLTS